MNRMEGGEGMAVPDGLSIEALIKAPFSLVLTDPSQPGNPIIFVNRAFERTTGYSADETVGRNCKFLQGPETSMATVSELRAALDERRDVTVDILNYRADGTPFWNRLFVSPIGGEGSNTPFFLGIQTDLGAAPETYARLVRSERALVEVRHRVKNHLAMIVGMIRLQARQSHAGEEFAAVARRVEALQLLYEELSAQDERLGDPRHENIDLSDYAERIARALSRISMGTSIEITVAGERVLVPLADATQVGLALSEIVTNSIQHGFSGRTSGRIEIALASDGHGGLRITVSDDGTGLPDGLDWPAPESLGGRIVSELVDGLDGTLDVASDDSGTTATIDIPAAHFESTRR